MSWSNLKGFNFRDTSGFVTDGTNETYVLRTDAYPRSVTIDGDTFNIGWEDTPSGAANRSAGVDRRLAGINYNSGPDKRFRIDLPASGDYIIRLALGDQGFSGNEATATISDTTTVLATLGPSTLASAADFMDASGVVRNGVAAWVANNAPSSTLTFSTTILRLTLIQPASTASVVAYLGIQSAGGGGSTGRGRLVGGKLVGGNLITRIAA